MCCCIPCCCCCCIPTIYRFAIAVGVAAFFTIVSLFSPGWGLLDVGSCAAVFKEYFDYDNADSYTIGLITNRHGIPTFSFEKYCTAAMFLALISEAAILVLITLIFFNLKHTYMPPTMMLLSASATFWLLTVAIVYPAKYSSTYKAKFGVDDACTELENGLGDNDLSFTPSYSYGGAVWSLIMCIVANIYGFVMLNEIYMWRDFSDFGQNRNQNWGWNRGNQNMNQGNMNWNGGNQNMNMTNMNCGNPNMGPGNTNWNGGNPNMGPGNTNWNGGNPNMGNMNYGGNPNMGPGNTNFGGNPNPGNMNMGKDNFGQGMGNPC